MGALGVLPARAQSTLPTLPSTQAPQLKSPAASKSSSSSATPRSASSGTAPRSLADGPGTEVEETEALRHSKKGLALEAKVEPFGARLFRGHFGAREDGLNPDYIVMPGDHVAIQVWGAIELSQVFVVDSQGKVFLPQVGPVQLAGVRNRDLTSVVREGLARVYTRNFEVYTNLVTAKPVGVLVTGGVVHPGRYAGIPSDSVLYFLEQAGGIDAALGSYRRIDILRKGQPLASVDLYAFILEGQLETLQFEEGDTIVVRRRGPAVALQGQVGLEALVELSGSASTGAEALRIVPEAARATWVTVSGVRAGQPMTQTLRLAEFRNFQLADGDRVELREEGRADAIFVRLEGEFEGPSLLAVKRGARLREVLHHIPVDRRISNLDGIHLKRLSVAQAQKDAIDDALFRLERSALLGLSGSDAETNIRVKEADLVQRFVERARLIQPLGRVVTRQGDQLLNVLLEEGDTIVIPPQTNVIRVSGEVFMAQAAMYCSECRVRDYVALAGGVTDRANTDRMILYRPSGQIVLADSNSLVGPGDEILVLPRVDSKLLQNALDITQVIYQVAVSAAVVLFLVP
jgi:protein involved in polysaccharide export with SLBB domain